MKRYVIAIDGPAGAGKGTIARLVASRLFFLYVDTGAMYRALTLKAMEQGVPLDDADALARMAARTTLKLVQDRDILRVLLDGRDVTGRIRTEEVSRNTHHLASVMPVREVLWKMQRSYRQDHDLVMEGRDIGSIVFPDAQLKIYLDASVQERARRRHLQLLAQGMPAVPTDLLAREIAERDARDRTRAIAPLVRLPDAVYVDSTDMTIQQEVDLVERLFRERSGAQQNPREET